MSQQQANISITSSQLKKIMPYASEKNIHLYLPFLNETMAVFNINTTLRVCHFLAQIAVESGELNYVLEIASGQAYDSGKLAEILGNKFPGDGPKYKGRGLIQLTGRANYQLFQNWLLLHEAYAPNIMKHPETLEQPKLACTVAGWYWDVRNINHFADLDNVVLVTKKVNGGRNGLDRRTAYLNRAKLALEWI
jgi:putative chitinase